MKHIAEAVMRLFAIVAVVFGLFAVACENAGAQWVGKNVQPGTTLQGVVNWWWGVISSWF